MLRGILLLTSLLACFGCGLDQKDSGQAAVPYDLRGQYWTTFTGSGSTVDSTAATTESCQVSFQLFIVGGQRSANASVSLKSATLGTRRVLKNGSPIIDGTLTPGTGGAAYDFHGSGHFDAGATTTGDFIIHVFSAATPYATITVTEASDGTGNNINSSVSGQGSRIASGG